MKPNKKLNVLLALTVLVSTIPTTSMTPLKADTIDPIEIDITGLAGDVEGSHSHILLRKYDDNYHWDECTVCGKVLNKTPHNIKVTYAMGETNASISNKKIFSCQDCGYYREEPYKYPYKDSPWLFNGGIHIYKYDSDVNENHELEPARDINGRLITENEPQPVDVYKDGEKVGTKIYNNVDTLYENPVSNYTWISDHEIQVTSSCKIPQDVIDRIGITQENFNDKLRPWLTVDSSRYKMYEVQSKNYDSRTREFNCTFLLTLKDLDKKYNTPLYFSTVLSCCNDYDPATNTMGCVIYHILNGLVANTNLWDPEITSTSVTPVSSQDGYAREVYINATGKIKGSATGYVTVSTLSGEVVSQRSPFPIEDDSTYNINISLANLEVNSPTYYTLTIEDYFGKSITKAIQIPKMDSKPPVLQNKSSIDLTSGWAKSKTATLSYKDTGIGQVQTSMNLDDEDFYQAAKLVGTDYTQTYKFVGDIYEPRNLLVFAKDGLGNYQTEIIPIDKIDNTPPNVTALLCGIDYRNGCTTLHAFADDSNVRLGEGSGVKEYYFSSPDASIVSRNDALNKWQTSDTITIKDSGTYTIKVRDLVGNESEPVSMEVEKPNLVSISLLDGSDITVTPDLTESAINQLLRTYATYECTLNYWCNIEAADWKCPSYNPSVPGDYDFTCETGIPDTITNTDNISTTLTRTVHLLPATLRDISYDPLPINVDFGTSKQDIISRFTEKAVITETNGTSYECPIKDWTSDSYTDALQGTYIFKGILDLPEGKLNDLGRDLIVSRLVTVGNPTVAGTYVSVDGIDTSVQKLTVPFGTTYDDIMSKLITDVKVELNNGRAETVHGDVRDIQFSPSFKAFPGTYYGKLPVSQYLPNYIKNHLTGEVYMNYEVTVLEPTGPSDPSGGSDIIDPDAPVAIEDINSIFNNLPMVSVPFGLDFDSAAFLLDKNIKVEVESGKVKSIPIDVKSWKSETFNGFTPNTYPANTEFEIPPTMTNNKELSTLLEQKMQVQPEINLGILTDKLPILVFPYGTSITTINANLPTEVPYKNETGNISYLPIDNTKWEYTYKRWDEPGNYIFKNHMGDDLDGNQDVRQIVVITNRTIIKYEPVDKPLPDPTKQYPTDSKKDIDDQLPKKIKITLNDNTEEIVPVIWSSKPDPKNQSEHHYKGTPILPKHTVFPGGIQFDLTFSIPTVPAPAPSTSPSDDNSSASSSSSSSTSGSSSSKNSKPLPTATPTPTPIATQLPANNQSSTSSTTYDFIADSVDWAKDSIIQTEKLGAPSKLDAGRMYVPIRHAAYALGLNGKQVVWNDKTQKITLSTNSGKTVILTPGSNIVYVNGKEVKIDGAPYIDTKHDNRVMLSLSQVAKLILPSDSYSIEWLPTDKTMRITIKH